jgi:hypothetical protein
MTGNEDFRRMVWLEASLRNVKTIGYDAIATDHELLRREREARQLNRLEPMASATGTSAPSGKQSARGGSRKAVLVALEAVLVAKGIGEGRRAQVMAEAAENLAARMRNGEQHRVKVYDRAAPRRQPAIAPTRATGRERERTAPVR